MFSFDPKRQAAFSQQIDPLLRLVDSIPDFVFSHSAPRYSTEENLRTALASLPQSLPCEQTQLLSRSLLVNHGTYIENLPQILRDDRVLPFRQAAVGKDPLLFRLKAATDLLDMRLGLDAYCFLSVGRTSPGNNYDVILCFPNSVAREPGALIATKEIVHYGAWVSKEGAAFHALAHGQQTVNPIQLCADNARAAKSFFASVIDSQDYMEQVMPRILGQRELSPPQCNPYFGHIGYLNEKTDLVKYGDEAHIKGSWEGPQLMRGPVSLSENPPLFLVMRNGRAVSSELKSAGVSNSRIFHFSEAVQDYTAVIKSQLGKAIAKDSRMQEMLGINLALRDLTIIATKRSGEPLQELKQIGFKSR